MNFDLYNRSLKIRKSIEIPTPKVGAHLGVWRFIPSHSPIPRSMKCDSRASHLARTFASPCFGRKPKARVATLINIMYVVDPKSISTLALLSIINTSTFQLHHHSTSFLKSSFICIVVVNG